jgi:hypothetical protein
MREKRWGASFDKRSFGIGERTIVGHVPCPAYGTLIVSLPSSTVAKPRWWTSKNLYIRATAKSLWEIYTWFRGEDKRNAPAAITPGVGLYSCLRLATGFRSTVDQTEETAAGWARLQLRTWSHHRIAWRKARLRSREVPPEGLAHASLSAVSDRCPRAQANTPQHRRLELAAAGSRAACGKWRDLRAPPPARGMR